MSRLAGLLALAALVVVTASAAVPAMISTPAVQAAPAATPADATIYACITTSHTLAKVSVIKPPACAVGTTPVQWQGQAGQPVPSPSPTTSSPSPSPTATSPSPSPTVTSPSPSPTTVSPTPTTAACVTSTAMGTCGPYTYPQVTGSVAGADCPQDGATCVGQDVWNPVTGWQQTLNVNSPGDWAVTATMPAGNTAVVSYPNVYAYYDRKLPGFAQLTSSFAETTPAGPGTLAEASYDIWFDNPGLLANEVMIQTDFVGRDANCGGRAWAATGVQFGGSNGVPVSTWDLCDGGGTQWWESASGNIPSGSVDILAMLNWLVTHGYLDPGASLHSVSYGWEISSTGGVAENFKVSGFSITGALSA